MKIFFIIKLQIFSFLKIFGIRDRFRCPKCGAIGTWKPHGGIFDSSKSSGKRWLCKWCGFYKGIIGNKGDLVIRQAFIDKKKKCWRIEDFYNKDDKYKKVIPKEKLKGIDPWAG